MNSQIHGFFCFLHLIYFELLHFEQINIKNVYTICIDFNCKTITDKPLGVFHVVDKSFNLKTIKYHAFITYNSNRELISIFYDGLKLDKEDSKLSNLILPCCRLNHFRCVILSRRVLTTSEDLAWTPETRWFWSFWWSCKKLKRLVFSLQVQHYISDSSLHRLSK